MAEGADAARRHASPNGTAGIFLNATRLRAWSTILGVGLALFLLLAAIQAAFGLGGAGADLALDFTCYRGAGRLVAEGRAAAAYLPAAIAAAENAERALPAGAYFPFYYPPPYLLLCRALVLLPYWASLVAFLALGLIPLVWALRALVPAGTGLVQILAYPGIVVTIGTGQNGALTAACLAVAARLAQARPALAGAALGVLLCKPHLGLLAGPALLLAGRWRMLAGMLGTFAGLCLASLLLLGWPVWEAFLAASTTSHTLFTSSGVLPKLQSTYAAALALGGGASAARAAQAVMSGAAILILARIARAKPDGRLLSAAIALCGLAATPYLQDYDLVCLATALAVLATRLATGGLAWRLMLMAGYILPLLARGVADRTALHLAPPVMAGLLACLVQAARAGARTAPGQTDCERA